MSGIGQRIRDARSALGWSQNELASRAGVKQPTLQRIEAGLRLDPSVRTIAALAVALGQSVDALLGLAEPSAVHTEASRIAFDAIEDLTRHVAELEGRMDRRLTALEDGLPQKNVRRIP